MKHEKVYCNNCRWKESWSGCAHPNAFKSIHDPMHRTPVLGQCASRNKDNDCADFAAVRAWHPAWGVAVAVVIIAVVIWWVTRWA